MSMKSDVKPYLGSFKSALVLETIKMIFIRSFCLSKMGQIGVEIMKNGSTFEIRPLSEGCMSVKSVFKPYLGSFKSVNYKNELFSHWQLLLSQ